MSGTVTYASEGFDQKQLVGESFEDFMKRLSLVAVDFNISPVVMGYPPGKRIPRKLKKRLKSEFDRLWKRTDIKIPKIIRF